MASLLTEEQLITWILQRLGAPIIEVELDRGMLENAIESAKRWFAGKKGIVREGEVMILANTQEYVLPDDVDAVIEVAFTDTAMNLSLMTGAQWVLPDQSTPFNSWGGGQTGGLYSTLTQSLSYLETARRVLGVEADWEYDNNSHKLRVFPSPKQGGKAIYTYKGRDFTLEQLRERDHDLVKRYALATAKEMLGYIRRKREMLGANGPVTLDGKEMVEEAKAELEKLDEELGKSGMPMPFLTS